MRLSAGRPSRTGKRTDALRSWADRRPHRPRHPFGGRPPEAPRQDRSRPFRRMGQCRRDGGAGVRPAPGPGAASGQSRTLPNPEESLLRPSPPGQERPCFMNAAGAPPCPARGEANMLCGRVNHRGPLPSVTPACLAAAVNCDQRAARRPRRAGYDASPTSSRARHLQRAGERDRRASRWVRRCC
jgi:hypothetical protein